jgi:hypothetical protein
MCELGLHVTISIWFVVSNRADWQSFPGIDPYQIPASRVGGQHEENFGLGGSHLVKIDNKEDQSK